MIISITGANGYIGKLLVKLLISKGITVHILCRNQSEFEFTENVKVFKGDLTDPYFNATVMY
jgi:uncharacterized protein YbjT (DUF2867 family)